MNRNPTAALKDTSQVLTTGPVKKCFCTTGGELQDHAEFRRNVGKILGLAHRRTALKGRRRCARPSQRSRTTPGGGAETSSRGTGHRPAVLRSSPSARRRAGPWRTGIALEPRGRAGGERPQGDGDGRGWARHGSAGGGREGRRRERRGCAEGLRGSRRCRSRRCLPAAPCPERSRRGAASTRPGCWSAAAAATCARAGVSGAGGRRGRLLLSQCGGRPNPALPLCRRMAAAARHASPCSLLPAGRSAARRADPRLQLRILRLGGRLHGRPRPGRHLLLHVRRGVQRLQRSRRGESPAAGPAFHPAQDANSQGGDGRGRSPPGLLFRADFGWRCTATVAFSCMAPSGRRPGHSGCRGFAVCSVLFLPSSAGGL